MRAVLLVSDKQSRLKPCRRCGYSLVSIAGAKNCPECGLAVRISLASNNGLDWSSPRWQRFMAVAFAVLTLGILCKAISTAARWIMWGYFEEYYKLERPIFVELIRLDFYSSYAHPIICGLALCMLAKGERRYPDVTVGGRRVNLVAGLIILVVGLLQILDERTLWSGVPDWLRFAIEQPIANPWMPVAITAITCTYAMSISSRGNSRWLRKLSYASLYPAAAGVSFWLFSLIIDVFHTFESLACDLLFPLSMIVILIMTIRVLLVGAHEAELNWVTDP